MQNPIQSYRGGGVTFHWGGDLFSSAKLSSVVPPKISQAVWTVTSVFIWVQAHKSRLALKALRLLLSSDQLFHWDVDWQPEWWVWEWMHQGMLPWPWTLPAWRTEETAWSRLDCNYHIPLPSYLRVWAPKLNLCLRPSRKHNVNLILLKLHLEKVYVCIAEKRTVVLGSALWDNCLPHF